MSRHLLCLLFALTLLPLTNALGAVGIFENNQDIHPVGNIGSTQFVGMVDKNGTLVEQYLITGHGSDIWGTRDQFHYAFREVSGDWRVSADAEWATQPANSTAKVGAMIRASTADNAVEFNTNIRNYLLGGGNVRTDFEWRPSTGGSSSNASVAGRAAGRIGIQRVLIGGEIPAIESIADFGSGWERVGNLQILPSVAPSLADKVLLGISVTSHEQWTTATARVTDVVYERAEMVGPAPTYAVVPAGSTKAFTGTQNGFVIRTVKVADSTGWGRAQMDALLDGTLAGLEEGQRVSQFVNLHDSTGTGRGAFSATNNFPDESYPGIDPFESPTADTAAGDDDNNYATEVLAVIHLTAGMHIIGVNDDDGTIVKVGGVEIGRSAEWKGVSNTDLIFQVQQEGFYTLRARNLEGSGGSALELHEIVKTADGSWKRILLGDVANGGSAVYVPEPATIALLGLGALALLRRKRGGVL